MALGECGGDARSSCRCRFHSSTADDVGSRLLEAGSGIGDARTHDREEAPRRRVESHRCHHRDRFGERMALAALTARVASRRSDIVSTQMMSALVRVRLDLPLEAVDTRSSSEVSP